MTPGEDRIAGFEREYRALLGQMGVHSREVLLVRAYALGRTAALNGIGIPDVLQVHRACAAASHRNGSLTQVQDPALLDELLEDVLSPFELVYRGVEQANESLRNVNQLLETEARRIAHSLHDEAGQLLATLSLAVQCLGCEKSAACDSGVSEIKDLVSQAENMFRRLSHEMRPRVLEEMGLVPAIRFLADGFSQRRGLAVEIDDQLGERLCPLLESTIYRMVQVALPNVVKHAAAAHATIRLARTDSTVKCSVIDDGKGMDPRWLECTHPGGGLGLLGIRERAKALGGKLHIQPVSPHGSEVVLSLPLIG